MHEQNQAIAKALMQKADTLQEKASAGPRYVFRAKAHRDAAEFLLSWEHDIGGFYEHAGIRGLENLPGIGRRIAFSISRMLEDRGIHHEIKKQSRRV